jgi:MFS family permease
LYGLTREGFIVIDVPTSNSPDSPSSHNRELGYARIAKQNFLAFLWHALFLAFVSTFIDVNTILSSFILKIGGSSTHVGILSGISIGLPLITQLLFAGFLAGRPRKKPFLILGLYLRVVTLAGMGYTLSISDTVDPAWLMLLVFFWLGVFSISGAFAGISYTDILGKTLPRSKRGRFLIIKQLIASSGMLISALIVRRIVIAFPYPHNYTIIFFVAAGLLFVAGFGFLAIKEDPGKASHISGTIRTLKAIPRILKADPNLGNYILAINLMGLSLTIIPFYVVLSKTLFVLTPTMIGNFLLMQFLGMILSTFLWNAIVRKFRFKGVAISGSLLGGLLPFVVLWLSGFGPAFFQLSFFLAGTLIAGVRIAYEGVLLEITTNDNRAVYAGISGALSLTTAVFPILAGVLINVSTFEASFSFTSLLVVSALFFFMRLKCPTPEDVEP